MGSFFCLQANLILSINPRLRLRTHFIQHRLHYRLIDSVSLAKINKGRPFEIIGPSFELQSHSLVTIWQRGQKIVCRSHCNGVCVWFNLDTRFFSLTKKHKQWAHSISKTQKPPPPLSPAHQRSRLISHLNTSFLAKMTCFCELELNAQKVR